MIQRKQTLFLLLVVLVAATLFLISSNFVHSGDSTLGISLTNTQGQPVNSWHYTTVILNCSALIIAFITIFFYKRRTLQIKLCYSLMFLELAITSIISFCPFVTKTSEVSVETSGIASIIGIVGMMGAYLAAHYIKKDIELLKSADRIR